MKILFKKKKSDEYGFAQVWIFVGQLDLTPREDKCFTNLQILLYQNVKAIYKNA